MLLLSLVGCPTGDDKPSKTAEDFGNPSLGDDPVPIGSGKTKKDDHKNDPPEISRSRGTKGGIVVLWPRIWPHGDDAATRDVTVKVQQRLDALAKRAAGNRSIDVRPEPERSCPKEGCEATSVSAVIVVRDKACAAVAVVAGPGTSAGHILPWAGKVELTKETVAFRDAPEEQVKVKDYVPCATLLDGREDNEAAIARYITGLLPGG